MPIEFRCDSCQRLLRVPEENAGARARCPQCDAIQTVPGKSVPPPQPEVFDSQPAAPPTPWSVPTPGSTSQSAASNPFAEMPERNRYSDNPYESPYAAGYQTHESTFASARSRILAPAIILLIFAILGAGIMAMGSFGGIINMAEGDPDGIVALLFCGFALLLEAVIIIGCIRMMQLKNYGLAMTATIGSILCGLCSWLAIPFAIWALVVLCDAEVKRHFT